MRIRLEVTPGSAGANRFDVTVSDYDSGEPAAAEAVSLRFQRNDRPELGTPTIELSREPDAHWRGSGSALSIDGRWNLTVVVQTETDAVEVPLELETTRRTGAT